MKKVIIIAILGFLTGLNANAQIANQEPLDYSFGGVYRNSKGERLSKEDIPNYLSSYEYADYLIASRKFKNAVILTSAGVGCYAATALLLCGTITEINRYNEKDEHTDQETVNVLSGAHYVGQMSGFLIIGGVVCTTIGIPKIFIANGKLKKIATNHNNQPGASFSVGAQQYGYGFTLNF